MWTAINTLENLRNKNDPHKKAVRLRLENEKMAGRELKALMGGSTCL